MFSVRLNARTAFEARAAPPGVGQGPGFSFEVFTVGVGLMRCGYLQASFGLALLLSTPATQADAQSHQAATRPAATAQALQLSGLDGVLPAAEGYATIAESPTLPALAPAPDSVSTITTFPLTGFDVNAFLGATAYYNHSTPITGQNTVATSLEAGHIWNGHETLTHVTTFTNGTATWGGGSVAPLYDRHATWVAMFLGGRPTGSDPAVSVIQQGIAHGTTLQSAAIATAWGGSAYALGFSTDSATVEPAYIATFKAADVINSSYGYTDPAALTRDTFVTDALAYEHFETLHVVAAGNSGPGANTVGGPASGYNSLAVASLGNANAFDQVAGTSSRGPQTFGYYTVVSGSFVPVEITAARAAVDIAAPGTALVSAFYGGQTGGNNETLTGSPNPSPATTDPNLYTGGIDGTSFAAPLVAGGATLAFSAAKTLPELSGNAEARQSVVVRSLLLTGADKTTGWNNGQQTVTVSGTTFLQTTQSLDYAVGAGRMNLATTFDLQLNGQTGVSGTTPGPQGTVAVTGWDYGAAIIGTTNDYVLDELLLGDSTLTTTLSWMRPRLFDPVADTFAEVAQANLNLSVWGLDDNDAFTTLIARSESLYNLTEHLSFDIADTGRYGLRVEYPANTFDNTIGNVWGLAANPQDYGLSWSAVPVPEPATMGLVLAATAALGWRARWRRVRDTR